ncbi:ABC transporter ATP-binding protein [Streptomyces sp. H10-C2]|uniref:ABC transporter ATP-binding protein n=1 Tax=unclassified Streptomyces TaxID=2593676 RepID=UPI0024BBA495|nr:MULTISPECIES: ABC transporter ATP-binding protein [unclassified Streptomyces]MDJ0345861.1 ABC transporter ATP-binding protein [Streptomyces sp. PH10-H1]MDJ0371173.1 ABC transporter ATP-binding protein [Streptomyces sp. H10-C2]
MTQPLVLDIRDLTVEFRQGRRTPPLRAVDGVSLSIAAGETVGLVGESGSGKSTIGRAVLGLNAVHSGQVHFEGADITRARPRVRRGLSARLQVVFQDPYSSLNPARTIGQTLAEPLLVHRKHDQRHTGARITQMLERVGMPPDTAARYPGQFSGGQRQRIAIARALMLEPSLVICDEPVSALDLSIQAQVMNLLAELQSDLSLSYLFIAHDLPVVRHLSHRIVVLYRGQVMESGPSQTVYADPVHPYTRALLEAVPEPDPRVQRARTAARGTADSTGAPAVGGCVFAHRCPYAIDKCHSERPLLRPVPGGGGSGSAAARSAACHRAAELAAAEGATVPTTPTVSSVSAVSRVSRVKEATCSESE